MRILAIAWKYDRGRGSEYVASAGWAEAWAALGHEVVVLAGEDARPAHGTTTTIGAGRVTVEHLVLPPRVGRRGPVLRYWWWQRMALARARVLHRQQPFDLGHHLSTQSLQQATPLRRLGIPYVFGPAGGGQVAARSFAPWFAGHWRQEWLRSLVQGRLLPLLPRTRAALRSASVVLGANRESAALARRLGAQTVAVEPDAVIPADYRLVAARGAADHLRLLWVGRSFPRKGLNFTLESLAKIDPSVPWKLTVIGGGPLAAQVPEWVARLGLGDRVTLRGQVPWDEVQRAYREHDVFIFTSLRDSGPSQLMEALAMGLPVVSLDYHGQGVLVGPDRGITVPPDEPLMAQSAIAAAVATLHRDRALLARLSAGAVAYADRHSGAEKLARLRALLPERLGGLAGSVAGSLAPGAAPAQRPHPDHAH